MKFGTIFKSWTPQHALGISVVLVMAVGGVVVSQTMNAGAMSGNREPAQIQRINHYLEQLNRQDRTWLGNQIRENRCYDNIDANTRPCPAITSWSNGDPSFNWNPYYNRIPRNTRVFVDIQCDASSGQFKTQVILNNVCPNLCPRGAVSSTHCRSQRSDCGNTYFKNPYDPDGVGPFSNSPTNFLTSPGAFNELDFSHFRRIPDSQVNINQTAGRIPGSYSTMVNELHQVSGQGRSAAWAGAWMTNAILIDGPNDFFIHGSSEVTGRPASRGCMRLKPNDAKALYDLARRVGTNNFTWNFGGYGPHDPRIGGPACSLSEEQWNNRGLPRTTTITQADRTQRNQQSRRSRNVFQRFFSWLKGGNQRRSTTPQHSDR